MTRAASAKTSMELNNEHVFKVCNNVHVINTADAYNNILRETFTSNIFDSNAKQSVNEG